MHNRVLTRVEHLVLRTYTDMLSSYVSTGADYTFASGLEVAHNKMARTTV